MYKVKKSDLIGEIKDFPIEVVQKMVEKQVHQGNKADVKKFQEYKRFSFADGGFYWGKTKEGQEFWYNVIDLNDFDLFFKKYPKKEEKKELKGINLLNEFEESLKGEHLKKSIDIMEKIISDTLEHPDNYIGKGYDHLKLDISPFIATSSGTINCNTPKENTDRPPLEVLSKFDWDKKRIYMLKKGIIHYLDVNKAIPVDWTAEYNELVKGKG